MKCNSGPPLVNFVKSTRPDIVLDFDEENLENIKSFNDRLRKMDPHNETDPDNSA